MFLAVSLGWQLPHFAITSESVTGIPGSLSAGGCGWADSDATNRQLITAVPALVRHFLVIISTRGQRSRGDGRGQFERRRTLSR